MKVAIVCPYDLTVPGGVQQVALELTAHLRSAGDEATLIGPGRGAGWVSAGRSVSLPANRSRAPVMLAPVGWRRVSRALEEAEVVHVHEPFVPLVGLAALRADKPTVVTFHADPSRLVRRLYGVGARLGAALLDERTVTAVSVVAASSLPASWGPVEIVPNGVDVASFRRSRAKDPHLVAFVGRDETRKGFDVLALAWPMVVEQVPSARLLVLGFTRDDDPPATTYLGRVSEEAKRVELARAALAVMPNLGGESFGIVVAEAMAAGCAVVASDLPAFRDVAGAAAQFFTPGDHRALARELVSLLNDPVRVAALGEEGQKRAEAFAWPQVVSAYQRLYRQALEST